MGRQTVPFSILEGLIFTEIIGLAAGSEEVTFKTTCGRTFLMFHQQDCCESVDIDDIWGDPMYVTNVPILKAEVVSNENEGESKNAESYTWTFYKLASILGSVDIRWFGSSNGYYGESVDFYEVTP